MGKSQHGPAVKIWTDGSCYPNPDGKGGWALVARWRDRQRTRVGFSTCTTNNEMELMAVRHALLFVRPSELPLHIYTDSKYVCRAINEWVHLWRKAHVNWVNSQGKPVANRELIDEVRRLLDHHKAHNKNNSHIQWTKGHAGNRFNELADSLAGIARIDQTTDWNEETDTKFSA